MADLTTKPVLSVCATVGSKLPNLVIKDGQLIFVQDKHRIALDFGGKRIFYNQIEELATDAVRTSMLAPVAGLFYFVIETAVLWTYRDKWVQITTPPKEVVFFVEQVTGHVIPDVRQFLAIGAEGILEKLEENQAACADDKKKTYYEAMKISVQAMLILAERYATG